MRSCTVEARLRVQGCAPHLRRWPHMRTSITDTTLFEKHAATLVPSGFQHTSKIPPCPRYVLTRLPDRTSQMWRHLSNEPLARYCPFAEKATEYTGSLRRVRVGAVGRVRRGEIVVRSAGTTGGVAA